MGYKSASKWLDFQYVNFGKSKINLNFLTATKAIQKTLHATRYQRFTQQAFSANDMIFTTELRLSTEQTQIRLCVRGYVRCAGRQLRQLSRLAADDVDGKSDCSQEYDHEQGGQGAEDHLVCADLVCVCRVVV